MSEHENFSELELEQAAAAAELAQEAEASEKEAGSSAKKADSKGGKPAKKKAKPGLFAGIARYFREMRSELKKVAWPSRKQTVNNTIIVITCVLFIGVFIWAFDWIARLVIEALLNLAGQS